MLKKICFTSLFVLLLPLLPAAVNATCIDGFFVCQADAQGDFKGDTILRLNDGSAWKVHPTQTQKANKWYMGDNVHVTVRTSHYFFKREHKFLLVNDNLKESVKVMLFDYGPYARYVVDTSYPAAAELEEESEENLGNKYGQLNLHISDGSVWTIKKDFDSFDIGTSVYYGCKEEKDDVQPFLIRGLQREATWHKASLVR